MTMDIVEALHQVSKIRKESDPDICFIHADTVDLAIAEIMRLRTTLEQVQEVQRQILDTNLSQSNPSFRDMRSVHHIDGNPLNNNPANLSFRDIKDEIATKGSLADAEFRHSR